MVFEPEVRVDPELLRAARAAVSCLAVGPMDSVLVLCNPETRTVAAALAEASRATTHDVRLDEYPTLSRNGEEPPALVTAAMRSASVIFAATTYSVSHTAARAAATERGARIATMVGVDAKTFSRAISVDYALLKRDGELLANALSAASTCRITSAAGTDVRVCVDGRDGISDDGALQERAAWGNLPAGEAYVAPIETQGDGVIVFDGSLAGYGLLDEPVQLRLVQGRVTEATGAAGRWLLETLDSGGPNGRLIAEVGIGTNPAAIVTGNTAEDEKAIGTAHLAFGTSVSIGGENDAGVHIDGVLREPNLDLDGLPVLRRGELVLKR